MMAGIHGADTKPERIIRKALFSAGFRYRKNCAALPGKPDIKLTKYHAVIFVHGCFWHGHACRYFRIPGSNSEFWSEKIGHNRERDARDMLALIAAGWRVCIVWECATRKATREKTSLVGVLSAWIKGNDNFIELYDPEATRQDAGIESPADDTGIRHDIESFVAERRASYNTGGSTRR